ncbi:MAG TPA: glycosyltransferase family 2 protein [Syntrophobacteria bacterium]|nr:glycosyltransferase family 2 protein [Syntrophobacteria bacterium]
MGADSIDIVIVNYNSTDYVLECLASIYGVLGGMQAQVFVEDNGSGDSVERVLARFPEVRLSRNRSNMGFAMAVNKGLKHGTAPYIIVLNPDSRVGAGFVEGVLGYMDDNPGVGILGPKILNADGSTQGSARSFPHPLTALFGRASLLSKWFPNNSMTRRNVRTSESNGIIPMEVDWVSGACMVVRRQAVSEVGPLDERFFLYWEDADWCRRMWQAGWKVVYFPQASVVHHVGGSSGSARSRSLVEFHRSAYRLFAKYAKGPERLLKPLALWVLALRLLILFSWNGLRDVIETNLASEGGGNGPPGRAGHPTGAGEGRQRAGRGGVREHL